MDRALEEKKSYEKNFKTLYSKLNNAQKQAVDALDGPVMVLAGPGTGKTQILAMRIARILADPDLQVSPSNILCLTYTESGTVAMRNRLISIIGPIAYQVRIHTFHSFCNEIIKENPDKFFFANQINDLQRIQAMSNFVDELDVDSPVKPFGDKHFYRNSLLKVIQNLKRESITPEKFSENISAFEEFINKNRAICMEFCSHNAKNISPEMRDLLMEKLFVMNSDSPYLRLIQEYNDFNEKATDFKGQVKSLFDFAEKNIPRHKEILKTYIRYQEFLETNKIYDFEDMILRVINQFKKDPDLLARYQEQFQYILVDEYQDTNGSQNEILDLLLSYYQENPNIFVVGDDDQSIYRFQGASLENIIRFYRLYKNHPSLIVLEENYRSHQNILDISLNLINESKTRIVNLIPNLSKILKASLVQDKQEIEIIKTYDLIDEIFFIGKKIKSLLDSGVHPSEIAILYRSNRSAIVLMDYLSRMNIPCAIDVGENILEGPLMKRLLDLLKLIANPESNSDILFNVLNYDFILESDYFKNNNIGLKDIFEINLKRRQESKPDQNKILFQYLLEDSRFAGWANKILECNQQSFNLRLDELVEKILYDFGYMKFIFASPDYLMHVSNLSVFFNEIRSLIENPIPNLTKIGANSALGLKEFNQYLDLLCDSEVKINSKTLISRSNSVKLMTAHKSKGLEYEHVFIHSCIDNSWKSKNHSRELKLPPCLTNQTDALLDKQEDDRRLFYVALTRAKKGLYLLYHTYNESGREQCPSIYITELAACKQVKFFDHTVVEDSEDYQQLEREKLAYRFKSKPDLELIPEKDFIDSLLENYKMSITHLNNFLYCPRKFFYQNLLRVPSAKDRSSSFGTAIHASLYDLMQRFKTQVPTSAQEHQEMLDYLKKQYVSKLEYERLPAKDHDDLLKKGLTTLDDYYNHYKDSLNPKVLLEYNFDAFGLSLDGIQITGKLDKVEIIDEATNRIKVVDYKTGKSDKAKTKLKPGNDYHRQIVFYQLLCDLANATGLFKYKMQSGEIDFVQKEKDVFLKSPIFVTKDDISDLKLLIQDSYNQIKDHNFKMTDDFDNCKSCNFKNVCGR